MGELDDIADEWKQDRLNGDLNFGAGGVNSLLRAIGIAIAALIGLFAIYFFARYLYESRKYKRSPLYSLKEEFYEALGHSYMIQDAMDLHQSGDLDRAALLFHWHNARKYLDETQLNSYRDEGDEAILETLSKLEEKLKDITSKGLNLESDLIENRWGSKFVHPRFTFFRNLHDF